MDFFIAIVIKVVATLISALILWMIKSFISFLSKKKQPNAPAKR